MSEPEVHFEVRYGTTLPAAVSSSEFTVTRGYAVQHQGPAYRSGWLFFPHLEPAWAYGRAAHSSPLSTHRVLRQAALTTTLGSPGDDRLVLHLAGLAPWQAFTDFETRTLNRWVEGITDSPAWQPLH